MTDKHVNIDKILLLYSYQGSVFNTNCICGAAQKLYKVIFFSEAVNKLLCNGMRQKSGPIHSIP